MLIIEKDNIDEIAKHIKSGKVVAVPTETVFGLAVSFDNDEAIEKLKRIKERDGKPISLMLSNTNDISNFGIINDKAKEIINKYLPGELTLIIPKKDNVLEYKINSKDTIGIRVPDDEFLNNLISKTGAILMTSANKKGQKECINSDEVQKALPEVDVVVTGKSCGKIPTTVVKVTDNNIEILRQGKLFIEG